MNWQLVCLKEKQNKDARARMGTGMRLVSRKQCALNVAICFRKSQWGQERILRQEKSWIQNRKITVSQQGKNAKMRCMLEDEGTMIVVQECIAGAGASEYPRTKINC